MLERSALHRAYFTLIVFVFFGCGSLNIETFLNRVLFVAVW